MPLNTELKEVTVVDKLYEDFGGLLTFLDEGQEISLRNLANDNFGKTLLLASASYFEHQITQNLYRFFHEYSSQNELIGNFFLNKAVNRQYHTLFNWKDKNANAFFGLFGDGFKEYMKSEVKESPELDDAVRAFLDLGLDRNRLVHENFGSFTTEKTSEEIFEQYKMALIFVEAIPRYLRKYCSAT